MSKLGCYCVGDRTYSSYDKVCALRDATASKQAVSYKFYDEVWTDFKPLLNVSLDVLYLIRATQLRAKYSWITLHYSGGSDSHNILMTFLNNKIHLDEVLVKWSRVPKDRGWYSPTRLTGTARDSLAEWDYAIKPSLDWLAKYHPKVKITVVDYTEDLLNNSRSVDDVASKLSRIGLTRGILGSYVQRSSSSIEEKLLGANRGKHSCHVFGVEKPILERIADKIYFKFTDVGSETAVLEHEDLRATTELFYWTPDLPELAYTQAYSAAAHVLRNPKLKKYLAPHPHLQQESLSVNEIHTALKPVLYPRTWTPKFQAPKPNVIRSDWWWWVHESPELESLRQCFNEATSELYSGIRSPLVLKHKDTNFLKPLATKPFYLMDVLI